MLIQIEKLQVMYALGMVKEVSMYKNDLGFFISILSDDNTNSYLSDSKGHKKFFRSSDSALNLLRKNKIKKIQVYLYEC